MGYTITKIRLAQVVMVASDKRITSMKIMFAVASYWPSKDGVAQITGYLAEGLAKRGHQVFVLTSSGNRGLQILPEEEMHENVKIDRMRVNTQWPIYLKGRDAKSNPQYYRKVIGEFAPNILIVVCAQTWTLDWIGHEIDKVACPTVFYCHGYSAWKSHYHVKEELLHRNIIGAYQEFKEKKYFEKLYKTIEKFNQVFYLSESNSGNQYAIEHGLKNGKVLENAIDDIFYEESMQHTKSYFKQENIKFLFVANYNENKNQDMLLHAFANAKIGNSTLVLSGFEENDYLMMLRKHAKEWLGDANIKNVIFNVNLSRSDVYELYRSSDVFVCPSKSEQSSIVAKEAAATGMPIITTDVGNAYEIDGAIIVSDEDEMRLAMEQMYKDSELREIKGRTLKKWVDGKGCKISDKVDAFEAELIRLCNGE